MSPGEGAGNPRLLYGPMSEGATATCRSLWDHLGQSVRIKSTVNRSPCTALVSCNFKPSIVQFLSIFRHQTIPSPAALLFFFNWLLFVEGKIDDTSETAFRNDLSAIQSHTNWNSSEIRGPEFCLSMHTSCTFSRIRHVRRAISR